jgi:putative transposon-encoded protein
MKAVVKKPISMQMHGFEVVEKVAESSGNSGRIYVPKKWIGKKVRAVLLQ